MFPIYFQAKRKKFLAIKRQRDTSETKQDIKRARLDSSDIEKTLAIRSENSCPVDPRGNNSTEKMINGHNSKLLETRYQSNISQSNGSNQMHAAASIASQQSAGNKISNAPPPIASLSNLGNTCFLNSVLYTLRFTPGFLHSLHHLVNDLGLVGKPS